MDEKTPHEKETESGADCGDGTDAGGIESVEGKNAEAKQDETQTSDESNATTEETPHEEKA
jgi:hypothetical protein